MPDKEELEERIGDYLDPWEISRLHQMADAEQRDPWKEGGDGDEEPAPSMG